MKAIARGFAPTARAWRISISPRKINSSSRKNERFCARWWLKRSALWRRARRIAILCSHIQREQKGETMPVTSADKRATFRKMHESGCFVLPNPYDVGSAKALQHLGFKAIASSSAGFAWAIGKSDNHVPLDDVLTHLAALCEAVDLPVNADFEGR